MSLLDLGFRGLFKFTRGKGPRDGDGNLPRWKNLRFLWLHLAQR